MEKICGIYKITNKINNKCYIGQSKDIIKRWKTEYKWHKLNRHLQSAFNKYGLENFDFEILEECSPNLLNEREQFWITIYNSFDRNFGYNKTLGGAGTLGRTFAMTEETKNKIRIANTGRKFTSEQLEEFRNIIRDNQIVIYCYETNKYYTSIGNAARELKICKDSIRHVITQQNNQALNYRFCKITDNINEFITNCQQIDNYLKENSLTLKQYYCKLNKSNKKEVKCIETGIIYESIMDASNKTGINDNSISKCCNNKQISANNYHFEFVNPDNIGKTNINPDKKKIISEKLSKIQQGRIKTSEEREKIRQANLGKHYSDEVNKKKGRPGRKLSEETKNKMRLTASKNLYNNEHKKKVICIETGIVYDCINECARQLNIDKCCISRVCNGKNKKAGGYTFKFIENRG